jgi:hypothetical protein
VTFEVATAIGTLPGLVAPGGTLLVIARAADEENPARDPEMMPWPLTRGELAARRAAAGRNRRIPPFSHLQGKRAIHRR